jgi:hypothetical protein
LEYSKHPSIIHCNTTSFAGNAQNHRTYKILWSLALNYLGSLAPSAKDFFETHGMHIGEDPFEEPADNETVIETWPLCLGHHGWKHHRYEVTYRGCFCLRFALQHLNFLLN